MRTQSTHAIRVKETAAKVRPIQFYAGRKCAHNGAHQLRSDQMKLHRDPVETCTFGQKIAQMKADQRD